MFKLLECFVFVTVLIPSVCSWDSFQSTRRGQAEIFETFFGSFPSPKWGPEFLVFFLLLFKSGRVSSSFSFLFFMAQMSRANMSTRFSQIFQFLAGLVFLCFLKALRGVFLFYDFASSVSEKKFLFYFLKTSFFETK